MKVKENLLNKGDWGFFRVESPKSRTWNFRGRTASDFKPLKTPAPWLWSVGAPRSVGSQMIGCASYLSTVLKLLYLSSLVQPLGALQQGLPYTDQAAANFTSQSSVQDKDLTYYCLLYYEQTQAILPQFRKYIRFGLYPVDSLHLL